MLREVFKEKTIKAKKKPLVLIEWGDAWTNGGWQYELREEDKEPIIVHSVGFLESQTEQGTTIVGRLTVDGDPGVRSFIPQGMIRKVTKIRY